MFQKRFVCLVAVLCCLLSCTGAALALEVDSDSIYCFSPEDFSDGEPLAGVCIMQLPEGSTGTVLLGTRVLQPGDILTAEQLAQLTFAPVRTELDTDAVVTYLPIYENRVEKSATVTIAIRGKEDKPPVAEDFTVETYKNLANEGILKVMDPEGQPMTYTVVRQPKRGTVELSDDGRFVYTPRKNKVGVDSFTYTATDPAGKVSREATVTVQILKPTESAQYTDTLGLECRFEAEWLRNTGLFTGEQVGEAQYFQPDKTVSKGEFLAMVIGLLEIPVEDQPVYTELAQNVPQWLKPYVAAAVRSGLLNGWQMNEEGEFDADAPISGGEAAVLLQNALDLPDIRETAALDDVQEISYSETAVAVMHAHGVDLEGEETLNRGQTAQLLYQVSRLAQYAPGAAVFRTE